MAVSDYCHHAAYAQHISVSLFLGCGPVDIEMHTSLGPVRQPLTRDEQRLVVEVEKFPEIVCSVEIKITDLYVKLFVFN